MNSHLKMRQRKSEGDVYLCYKFAEVHLSAQHRLQGRREDPAVGRGRYNPQTLPRHGDSITYLAPKYHDRVVSRKMRAS